MSRTRKIAPEDAVQAAMTAFWQHGYNKLGTRQLEEETGITRFTLQTAYGGKWPLFLAALDAYLDAFELQLSPNMTDGDLDTIACWFENRVNPEMLPDAANYGCFLLNSTVEFADRNEELNLRAERFYALLRNGFRAALNAVKLKRGIAQDFNVTAMSEVLLSATVGLNIIIRSATAISAGKETAYSIAALVRGWEKP